MAAQSLPLTNESGRNRTGGRPTSNHRPVHLEAKEEAGLGAGGRSSGLESDSIRGPSVSTTSASPLSPSISGGP